MYSLQLGLYVPLFLQASIEHQISICGQLIGISHFIHAFTGSRPALCKLQTEKVATVQSGRYTLVMISILKKTLFKPQ